MKVAELMQTNLKTISADSTLADAIADLTEAQVSSLPVIDRFGRAVGVLSTREVLKAEHENVSRDAKVLEIMASWPTTIDPDLDVRQAAQEMLYLNAQRLFVEFDGALVGVISQTDIVGAVGAARV
ncbi:MAG TPA: CBS domain-containing protein [Gemmatimonadales bacterium]|jgi:CBS domain-containing protein